MTPQELMNENPEDKAIFLDIETTGLNAVYGNEVTCISAITADQTDDDLLMVQGAMGEKDLLRAIIDFLMERKDHVLITVNGRKFDIPFIHIRCRTNEMKSEKLTKMKQFDLATDITKKYISCDDLASLFCVPNKVGDGLRAIQYYYAEKFEELKEYCRKDTEITQMIFMKYWSLKKLQQ